ncbi:type 2 lantibiotic biosynthesis LanM family protein [Hydrogenophaga sp. RAC07]|uniref:type 2 lanthipeptide synthetase LanM n=1 Tax=Hydrogenophaga sp. RAC07 TaxID=1842537 RepID=UPI000858556D|nr:type 2 lanthipeptide synthetase LanM [Hydrogenophaga sp. RAC07]AOF85748.1 type 2 lantibiotic biosynthesis LanM family protein [Hydrogenophaga sp. RAC07]
MRWQSLVGRIVRQSIENDEADAIGRDVPFSVVLRPIALLCVERVQTKAGRAFNVLDEQARLDLVDDALRVLSEATQLHLYAAFLAFLAECDIARLLFPARIEESGSASFDRFCATLACDRQFTKAWEYFGPTAGAVARLVLNWISGRAEFVRRVDEFSKSKVVSLSRGLSDPHRGGRQVIRFALSEGATWIYKPRSIHIEAAFAEFTDWLRGTGLTLAPIVPAVAFLGQDHGFVESVQQSPCRDEQEVEAYFRRCGALLATVWLLHGTDFSCENIVACGAIPVVVDLEGLFHPYRETLDDANGLASRELDRSVLRIGMLPQWMGASGMAPFDDSALGCSFEIPRRSLAPQWEFANTDQMRCVWGADFFPESASIPWLGNDRVSPAQYWNHVLQGFQEAYAHVLSLPERDLRARISQLTPFPTRLIVRHTTYYACALFDAVSPRSSFEVLDRHLESVGAFGVPVDDIIKVRERIALKRHDIPWFPNTDTAAKELLVEERLGQIGSADGARQSRFLVASFELRFPRRGLDTATAKTISPTDLLAEAKHLLDLILQERMFVAGDRIAWTGATSAEEHGHDVIGVLTPAFYNGQLGIAVAFGALYRAHSDERYLAVAKQCAIRPQGLSLAEKNVGLATGAGGRIAALCLLIEITGDGAFSIELLQLVRDELQLVDRASLCDLGLLDGWSGMALALCRVRRHLELETTTSLIALCADRLVSLSNSETPVGAAHGLAGVAQALLACADCLGRVDLRLAAHRLFEREDLYFSHSDSGWLDVRSTPSRVQYGWCWGRVGSLVARVGTPHSRSVSATTASLAMSVQLAENDSLCCGTSSAVNGLLDIGQDHAAQSLAKRMVERARSDGGYKIKSQTIPSLGLFDGIAGIAYTLLRAHQPFAFPSPFTLK